MDDVSPESIDPESARDFLQNYLATWTSHGDQVEAWIVSHLEAMTGEQLVEYGNRARKLDLLSLDPNFVSRGMMVQINRELLRRTKDGIGLAKKIWPEQDSDSQHGQ